VAARCLGWRPRAARHRQPEATNHCRLIGHRMDVRNTRVCPRTGRCKDAPRPRRRHSAVPGSSLSANSPWSRIFPVREPVAAWHCPRHFLSLTRLFHSLSASNSRSVRAIVCVAPTRSRAAIVLSLVRMITFDQPATAREAVPADCTARCAPSRSSSLRCGPPLTARAPPPALLVWLHAGVITDKRFLRHEEIVR
jgi:hypothetical protein